MNASESRNQTICLVLPPPVQSHGLWKKFGPNDSGNTNYNWLDYSLPTLELTIGLIFAITQIFHFFFKRLGLPLFTSQLLAGLTLSPKVLPKKVAEKLVTENSVQVLGSIGDIGFAFFLFLTGVKTDLSLITRISKRALFMGIISVVAPVICTPLILIPLNIDEGTRRRAILAAPIFSVTAFPTISYLLSELKITNSELGRLGLSAAIISDICSLFFMVCGGISKVAFAEGGEEAIKDTASVICYLAICFGVLRPAMKRVVRYTPESKPVHPTFITMITVLFLFSVSVSKWYPQYHFLAAYLLGFAVPHGPPLGSALVDKFESVMNASLLPLFITTCGMRVDMLPIITSDYTQRAFLRTRTTIATVIPFVKAGATMLPPLYSKMPRKDCLALACIMSCKGVVELSICTFLSDNKTLIPEVHSFLILQVLFLSSFIPALVKILYDPSRKYAGYHKRNITDSKPHSELQIIACIHVPGNVRATIDLLDVAGPTKDNPLAVNVLHLVKLRGQATPIFICHQKKRRALYTCSYSENVIVSFNKFEGHNWGGVSVNTFTSVSAPSLMHDDICTLALDKLASLIILPFHRGWFVDGSIESDDEGIRVLNSKVLEKAPCSVGILIDRGNIKGQFQDTSTDPSSNVAMIFLGGRDDIEALTFAKRMAHDSRICLTVVHLTASENNDDFKEWDKILDSVALRDVKTNGYINYMQKEVNDGPETAMIIRSMANEFNLIIVGRRDNLESPQTSGLKEWSEFPELGVLGDLLASIEGRFSILVVQQQQTK